jgi:hypothetical protein
VLRGTVSSAENMDVVARCIHKYVAQTAAHIDMVVCYRALGLANLATEL